MTYRNFGPEMLNAGRTRRQILAPQQSPQQQEQNFAGNSAPRQAAVGDLTRKLEAIANELGRLKSVQTSAPQLRRAHLSAPQPAFDSGQLNLLVQSLKNDVRTQMRDDLDAQYVRLHDELNGLNEAIAGTALQNSFKGEISELLSGLDALASGNRSIQTSQDKLSSYLQRELGELQSSLNGLARNENLSKLGDRWDSLESKWSKLEDRLDTVTNTDSSAHLFDISARISAIHDKMNDGGLESLENRLLMLAKSVDGLAQSRIAGTNVDFSQIDNRFDELSRAVAAIGTERSAPALNTEAFDQIEKAMSLLGRKLELVGSMSGQNPSLDAIETRLSQLNERFAELPDYFNQEPVMERIDRLAERVSALPTTTLSPSSIDALTEQLNSLTGEIRGNAETKTGSFDIFETLGDRLGSIEDRLQTFGVNQHATFASETHQVISALEQRFSELSAHLEAMQPSLAHSGAAQVDLSGLEQKLADISRQLAITSEPTATVSSFDRLEGQIAELSFSLSTKPNTDTEALSERFASLETLLSQNQHALLDSARKAAETAALQFKNGATDSSNSQIVSVIAGELASLEHLTRSTNERSTSAIEGIHGALTKIAERLSALEAPQAVPTPRMAPKLPDANVLFAEEANFAPSLEAAESDLDIAPLAGDLTSRKPRSPSEMAQAAASEALRGLEPKGTETGRGSAEPSESDDTPLNPGANVPDLNSILKRVREQKKATQGEIAKDADRKDYFSSIKRAAQAAAAEVQQIEPSKNSGAALGNLKSVYTKFRRPILMVAAAAIIAIAAIQLTSAFLTSDSEISNETALELPLETPAAVPESNLNNSSTGNNDASAAVGSEASNDNASNAARLAAEGSAPSEITPRVVETKPDTALAGGLDKSATKATDPEMVVSTDPNSATPEAIASIDLPQLPEKFGPIDLVEAAQKNDAKAQFEVGRRLADNQSQPELLAGSFAWFNASAAQGFAPAQYRVGNMFEKGLGVERSASNAKLWYQMAAEAGNASAMHNLAVLFASGVDGTPDSESALRWFQKAADLGVGDSQFNLGVMKGKGQGVVQDLEESYKWLAILAKSGDVEAASKRDEVAKIMRPEQLEAAKTKVELWKPQAVAAEANDLTIPDSWKIEADTTASVDVKKAIRNVQLILTKIGYSVGKPDGVMGENTRKAIRAFQQKENLAVSGEIDGPLVKALLARNG